MQFLSQFPQYFGDQPMTNGPVYVGAFVLLLAILALFTVDTPMKWALFAVSLLAILLSWGITSLLSPTFHRSVPRLQQVPRRGQYPGHSRVRRPASRRLMPEEYDGYSRALHP